MSDRSTVASLLYVEDEKRIQSELIDVLSDYCENLYVADNGKEGLELYKEHKPKIVVSDIKMPVMNGIDMVKEIKALNLESRIIFTTAFSDYEYLQEAIALQVDGYILKPISLDQLEEKLEHIIEDINNKEALEEKELMLIQQSKMAAMGEMLANIAHQWRQPLGRMTAIAMKVQSQIMIHDTISNEEALKCAKTIEEQTTYLSQTINDFRNFFIPSKIDSSFKVSEFIHKCINLVKASFENASIELLVDVDSNVEALGDPNLLAQAVINILNNARDAFENKHEYQTKLVFLISIVKDDDNYVVITIGDNAGGIAEEIIDRVFEPYFTTKFESEGTGLGLYITHCIITKNLKGSIEVHNEIIEHEGNTYKGAQFVIRLPYSKS